MTMKSSRRGILAISIAFLVLLPAAIFPPLAFVCRITGRVSMHCCCASRPETGQIRGSAARNASCCGMVRRGHEATAPLPVAPIAAASLVGRVAIEHRQVRAVLHVRPIARSRAPPHGPPLYIRYCSILV